MNTDQRMTQQQLEIMKHTLGINECNREPYRNYFLAGRGHPDNAVLDSLVSVGMMTKRQAPGFCSDGEIVYCCTELGRNAAIASLPTPKKQKRTAFDEYNELECCESFGEWLLGHRLPRFEYDLSSTGRWRYRMVRSRYSDYYEVCGDWCDTKKAAKASYKIALRASRASAVTNSTTGGVN